MRYHEQSNSLKQKVGDGFQGPGREGDEELPSNGYGVSVRQDEKAPKSYSRYCIVDRVNGTVLFT